MFARLFTLLLLMLSIEVQAQIFKWTGPDGKVNYSDTPPPKSIIDFEVVSISTINQNPSLPYMLTQAVNNMPVTLYSANNISQSVDARDFLMKNGIPFTEKTVSSNAEIDKFIQISGDTQIPVLFIGNTKLTGFNPGEWRTTLTQAGYPESNMLPGAYHFSEPQPLMPTTIVAPKTKTIDNVKPKVKPNEPPTRDPNGFQF